MSSREENQLQKEYLKTMVDEVRITLKKVPGVIDVGIGVKEVNDQCTHEVVYKVYVEQKKSTRELTPQEVIPADIKGVVTDVVIVPTSVPRRIVKFWEDDKPDYKDLQGGILMSKAYNGIATTGIFTN